MILATEKAKDALLRTANLNFDVSKSIAVGYMDGIFRHIRSQMTPENKSPEFVNDINETYIAT